MNSRQDRRLTRVCVSLTSASLFLLLCSPLAIARVETTVRAGGSGQTANDAVKDALKVATMKGCKTAVFSKDYFENKVAKEQSLTTFSGCIVKEFTYLRPPEQRGGDFLVDIEAIVVESQALDRLKRAGNVANDPVIYQSIQGNLFSAKVRLENRPRLIGFALDSYPQNALKLSQGRPDVKWTREKKPGGQSWDYTERGSITVSYQIDFDDSFLKALDDVLYLTRDEPGEKLKTVKVKKAASDGAEDVSPIGTVVALPFIVTGLALELSFGIIGCLFGACPDESQGSGNDEPKSSAPPLPEPAPSIIQVNRSHKFRDPGVFFQIREVMIKKEIAIDIKIYNGQELVKSTCEAISVKDLFAESETNLIIGETGNVQRSISVEIDENFERQLKVQSNIVLQSDCFNSTREGFGSAGVADGDSINRSFAADIEKIRGGVQREARQQNPSTDMDGTNSSHRQVDRSPFTPLTVLMLPDTNSYYPPGSIRRQEVGRAIVRVCVGADGRLVKEPELEASSGSPRLDAAAVKVAKNGTFQPGRFFDDPLEVSCSSLPISFGNNSP